MNRLIMNLAVVCLACSASGCGTIMNTGGYVPLADYRIYGGVRSDADRLAEVVVDGLTRKKEEQTESEHGYLTMFFLIDLPLSLVADTMTLPSVIYHQISPPPKSEAIETKESAQTVGSRGQDKPAEK